MSHEYQKIVLECNTRTFIKPATHTRYILPSGAGDLTTIELVLVGHLSCVIESLLPIEFNGKFTNLISFTTTEKGTFKNPLFVYNADDKRWELITCGYVLFLEQEFNYIREGS